MDKIKILVACEESQVVTIELRKLGHEAFSCDILPCSGGKPEWHIQGDAIIVAGCWVKVVYADECIYEDWDDDREMPTCPNCLILYADCNCPGSTQDDIYEYTDINGELHARLIEREKWDMMIAHPPCTYLSVSGLHWNKRVPGRAQKTEEALEFVQKLMDAPINHIAIENPISCISSRIRKPDQIIQPYEYGDDASKKTCLWLKNLPLLKPTKYCKPRIENGKERWSNQTKSGQNKLPPSPDRAKLRSKTYPGIAEALAVQFTEFIQKK